jgi:hypothetical protein
VLLPYLATGSSTKPPCPKFAGSPQYPTSNPNGLGMSNSNLAKTQNNYTIKQKVSNEKFIFYSLQLKVLVLMQPCPLLSPWLLKIQFVVGELAATTTHVNKSSLNNGTDFTVSIH